MRALVAAGLLSLTSTAHAQSPDAFWSLWTGREERSSARALGLAGANVALRDDGAAALANPALLAALPMSELHAGLGGPLRREFQPLGASLLLKDGLGLSVSLRRPSADAQVRADRRLAHESTETRVQLGQRFGRLAVGVGVRRTRLALDGQSFTANGDGLRRSSTHVLDSRVGATAGVAWLGSGWTVAATFDSGTRFEGVRTTTLGGRVIERGAGASLRTPWRVAAGASAYVSPRLTVNAQLDLRQAGRLDAGSAADRTPALAAERGHVDALRAGAQYAVPFERASLVLRGGVARLAASGLRRASDVHAMRWVADAPARTRVSGGVGLDFPRAAVDVAVGTGRAWAIEARLRF